MIDTAGKEKVWVIPRPSFTCAWIEPAAGSIRKQRNANPRNR